MTSHAWESGMEPWQGRVDGAEGELALRWHQVVRPVAPETASGLALLGFACDAGVRRNQGRPGAAGGPGAIRRQLANLPVRRCRTIFEGGTLRVEGDALEEAQEEFGGKVESLLERGLFPLGLGGGHEIAFGSFLGLSRFLAKREARPRIGILNLDAHFDLRSAERASSGTPFRQMAEACFAREWPFRYACLGVSPFANTEALFQRAEAWGVTWRLDEDMGPANLPETLACVAAFAAEVDHLYLTICLDVLPAAVAPGVSAPSACGVPLEVLERVVDAACATGKLRLADLAEMNPELDEDAHTAKVAARLVGRIAEGALRP